MPVTGTLSNHFKYQAYKKQLDLSADSIKICLMRSGFVFNKDTHALYKNVMGTISASDISFENASGHIHTAAGDFVAAGFLAGGKILVSGSTSNNTTYTITTVDSATQMTITEALVEEIAGDAVTIAGADELATGAGYTRNNKTLANLVLAEDDGNDRAQMSCDSVVWTATPGGIGPTPGCILFDDTIAEKTIIGYIDFGGEQTAGDGATFTISSLVIRLT